MRVFAWMIEGLTSESGEEKDVMIYLKAHRTASSLLMENWRPMNNAGD